MLKKLLFLVFLTTVLVGFGGLALAAPAPQQRIAQPIIINGQQVQGATVVTNGTVQSFTCPDPQQYATADQSSSGWACYDDSTGTWLLHAQPQQTAAVNDQSQVYYPNTTSAYGYYPYPYPYGYYPYPYYGYYGPAFAFGFGYGGYGYYRHGYPGYYGYRGYYGSHGHAFVGPGSVGHGSFGHVGGGHMGGGGAHFGGGGGGGGHGGGHR